MKKLLIINLILALCMTWFAAAEEIERETYVPEHYEYTLLEDDTAEIIDYNGDESNLVIPDQLDGYPVTAVGDWAFSNCVSLTSVTIPDGVTKIGSNPFEDCMSLTDINVSPDHPYLAIIDGVLFSKPDKRLVCYPCAFTAETYAIPQGIRVIGDYAFSDCYSLVGVTIPDGVTSIGKSAFSDCYSLAGVTIPDGVTSIGKFAFSNCDSLISVIIPDSVTTLGDEAFFLCSSLTGVTIGQGVKEIERNPFVGCTALTEINVSPNHPYLATIDGVLFSKPDKRLICYPCAFTAETYAIPKGIRVIGNYAFSDCYSLAGVTIPDGVTAIGESAFGWCMSLTSVTIPDSVTAIGDDAFEFCYSLTSVTIPDNVTEIGSNPFADCIALTEINVSPAHLYLAVIDGVLFSTPDQRLICYPCAFTEEIYAIPQGIRIIGDYAFCDCYSLTSVTIPDNQRPSGRRWT